MSIKELNARYAEYVSDPESVINFRRWLLNSASEQIKEIDTESDYSVIYLLSSIIIEDIYKNGFMKSKYVINIKEFEALYLLRLEDSLKKQTNPLTESEVLRQIDVFGGGFINNVLYEYVCKDIRQNYTSAYIELAKELNKRMFMEFVL